jgi:transcriptional regulator of acetoin/glycerol metabolism
MDPTGPRADVVKARHDFFERNDTSTGLVPPTILRSWRRCAERGFDSHVRPAIEPVGPIELRELHERNERLIRLCRPELEALTIEARDTGGLAILTDGAGFVLDAVGDASFAGKAAGVALRPGVRWAEASTGTNAIGTALVERRARPDPRSAGRHGRRPGLLRPRRNRPVARAVAGAHGRRPDRAPHVR